MKPYAVSCDCSSCVCCQSSLVSPLYVHSVATSGHWYSPTRTPLGVVTATRSPSTPSQQHHSTTTGKDLCCHNGQVPASTASSSQRGCSETTPVRLETRKWPSPTSTEFRQHQTKTQGNYSNQWVWSLGHVTKLVMLK